MIDFTFTTLGVPTTLLSSFIYALSQTANEIWCVNKQAYSLPRVIYDYQALPEYMMYDHTMYGMSIYEIKT